jgi:hypothetical protein
MFSCNRYNYAIQVIISGSSFDAVAALGAMLFTGVRGKSITWITPMALCSQDDPLMTLGHSSLDRMMLRQLEVKAALILS